MTAWEVVSDETGGAEEKDWLAEPETKSTWLFKPVTVKGGHRHGEDWAEKAVGEVAHALAMPCATVELAKRGEMEGTISLNLCPKEYDLQPGYIVMEAHPVEGFQRGNVKGRPGHSLRNIQAVLRGALPPPMCDLPRTMGAFDAFCGYVMLDALTANRDRHDENWSVLIPNGGEGSRRLCGSYDHASSLGYNLRDVERERRLAGDCEGLVAWAEKGTAWRLEHDPTAGPMTLVAAAAEAFQLAGEGTRRFWLDRLASLDEALADEVLDGLPTMSEPSRRFASRLLETNRRRILDECS